MHLFVESFAFAQSEGKEAGSFENVCILINKLVCLHDAGAAMWGASLQMHIFYLSTARVVLTARLKSPSLKCNFPRHCLVSPI